MGWTRRANPKWQRKQSGQTRPRYQWWGRGPESWIRLQHKRNRHAGQLQIQYGLQEHKDQWMDDDDHGEGLMAIPFTQYCLPDGKQKAVEIHLSKEIENKAHKLIEKGYRFEVELLCTEQVSATIVHPSDEYDAAITICNNGPDVPKAISKMIAEFQP